MSHYCPTCNELMLLGQSRHRCPPTFLCKLADEPASELRTIYAHDGRRAAEKFAETYDMEGEYNIVRRNGDRITVLDADHRQRREFFVEAEMVPSYYAREVRPVN